MEELRKLKLTQDKLFEQHQSLHNKLESRDRPGGIHFGSHRTSSKGERKDPVVIPLTFDGSVNVPSADAKISQGKAPGIDDALKGLPGGAFAIPEAIPKFPVAGNPPRVGFGENTPQDAVAEKPPKVVAAAEKGAGADDLPPFSFDEDAVTDADEEDELPKAKNLQEAAAVGNDKPPTPEELQQAEEKVIVESRPDENPAEAAPPAGNQPDQLELIKKAPPPAAKQASNPETIQLLQKSGTKLGWALRNEVRE